MREMLSETRDSNIQNSKTLIFQKHSIILFDGECNLCNGFVQFIIKRDKKQHFVFGSLQSEAVKNLLKQYHFTYDSLSTVVLLENDFLYVQSTAVLKILKQLPGWSVLYGFIIFPGFLRDGFYTLVAKYRYKLFGKRKTCIVPTPELETRFIK